MAYPTVFMSGSCDYTDAKLHSLDFQKWVNHIYYNVDNRVSSHPYLKFFLLNLRMRLQTFKQTNFLVSCQLNDAHLSIAQLRENLENNDDSVPRKIISVGKNFPNTDPYWKDHKKKLDSLCEMHMKKYGDSVAYFDTNSCAEFH